jgi:ligand-binding sensor domain-containing protein
VLITFRVSGQFQNFKNYNVADGLPFIHVYALEQDHLGALWVGGYGGLSRFDGVSFTNFSTKDGLPSHMVQAIIESSDKRLFAGTNRGLVYLDTPEAVQFKSINAPIALDILAIHEFKGDIWIGTSSETFKLSGDSLVPIKDAPTDVSNFLTLNDSLLLTAGQSVSVFTSNTFTNKEFENLPDFTITGVSEGSNNTLYFSTNKGIIETSSAFESVKTYGIRQGLPVPGCKDLLFVDSTLWIATEFGLAKKDGSQIASMTISTSQNANLAECLLKDSDGNLWLGTYNGLYRYTNTGFEVYDYAKGIIANFIYGIVEDQDENIWFGSANNGLFKIEEDVATNFTMRHGLLGNQVAAVVMHQNDLYAGTDHGLNKLVNGRLLPVAPEDINFEILSLLSVDQTLYIGGTDNLGYLRNGTYTSIATPSLSGIQFWTIHQSPDNSILAGAYQGGLYRWDQESLTRIAPSSNFPDDNFLAIEVDKHGNVWLATFEGIAVIPEGKDPMVFDESAGLNSNLIYSFQQDPKGNMWVGTNQGLNYIEVDTNTGLPVKAISYGINEGFAGVECNCNATLCDSKGRLWFGSVNGLFKFDINERTDEPKFGAIHLTGTSLFYRDTTLTSGVVLDPDENVLEFKFKSISLSRPDRVRYRYRLLGSNNPDWSPYTQDGFARFPDLNPGTYSFEAEREGPGASPNNLVFDFVIKAPFYQRVPFIAGSGLALAAIGLSVVRIRINQIRERERISGEMERVKLEALRSQMNPHFIFNSLNSIQYYINKNDRIKANKYLTLFARLMRQVLNNSRQELVPLDEDLQALRVYVELEQMRFESLFKFEIQMEDDDIEYAMIPPMLLQPFVENSILHAFTETNETHKILITFSATDSMLTARIEDNGIGRKASERKKGSTGRSSHIPAGSGLTFTRIETLSLHTGKSYSFSIQDKHDSDGNPSGTSVTLNIPLTS